MAERTGGVQSVDRVLDLLEQLSGAGGELALSDLAARTGLPLPTIHRLLRTLATRGYVRQQPNRRYALGARLIPLGEAAATMIGVWARPQLARIVQQVGESANLATTDGDQAVYVAQAESEHAMRMFTEVGRRVRLHTTGVGKALLSQLPDEEALAVLRRTGLPPATPNSIKDLDAMLAQLAVVRSAGYAVDEQEQELGVRCVAVPLMIAGTRFAISVSGPVTRMTDDAVQRAVHVLTATRRSLQEDTT
jgi:IclR family acetate operon transcriptional repressor